MNSLQVKAYMESMGFDIPKYSRSVPPIFRRESDDGKKYDFVSMETATLMYAAHIASTRKVLEDLRASGPADVAIHDASDITDEIERLRALAINQTNTKWRQKLDEMIGKLNA